MTLRAAGAVAGGAAGGAQKGATQRCWRRARVLDALTCDRALDFVVLMLDLCGDAEPYAPLPTGAIGPPRCAEAGARVAVVGHALFAAQRASTSEALSALRAKRSAPSVTVGRIAKRIPFEGRPMMVQTSCAVFGGNSGGAVINGAGDVIGIVCSNAQRADSTLIPRLNFSLAIDVVRPLVDALAAGDAAAEERAILELRRLDASDALRSLWELRDHDVVEAQAEAEEKPTGGPLLQDFLRKFKPRPKL